MRLQGGVPRTLFFPDEVQNRNGVVVAAIVYEPPRNAAGQLLSGCPTGQSGGDPDVPYIRTVTNEDGTQLVFSYTQVGQPVECVLDQVSVGHRNLDAGTATHVTYGYTSDQLTLASTPTQSEQYSLAGQTEFTASVGGGTTVHHYFDSCNSTGRNLVPEMEDLTVQWGTGGVCGAQDPNETVCWQQAYPRTTALASGTGNGTQTGWLNSKYWAAKAAPFHHQGRLHAKEDVSCTPAQACSPGRVEYGWDCNVGYLKYEKNKSGYYDLYGHAASAYPDLVPLVQTSLHRSASNTTIPPNDCASGTNDCEWYSTAYGPDQLPHRDGAQRKSVLTTSWYWEMRPLEAYTNRQRAIIKEGATQDINGTTVAPKYVATFFRKDRTSGGNCVGSGGGDPQSRTLEVRGPCEAGSLTAGDCSGTTYPITQYLYWPSTESGHRANRLKKTLKFPAGCTSTPVETTYNQYDVYGNATEVVDAAGVVTTYAYLDGKVTSKTVAGRTTTYGYDNGELYWVKQPEGNYEVFCHRTGTAGAACTGGTWTPHLQWKAKTGATGGGGTDYGATWSEKLVYTYAADGTVATESYRGACASGCSAGSGEERMVRKYSADAHKRPTWEAWGSAAPYKQTRSFDPEDNLSAVGLPYNSPPDFCNGGTSTNCARMVNDRYGRVQELLEYPSSGGAAITTRFCHDSNGNVTGVSVGGTSCTDARAAEYAYDDFGNLLSAKLPNTDNGSGGKGVTRYEYDAMGNVVKKQTEAQRAQGIVLEYSYDHLGRLTSTVQNWNGARVTLSSLDYDVSGGTLPYSPPGSCPQPAYTAGRLRKVTDPTWTTWYQYDEGALHHVGYGGVVRLPVRLRAAGERRHGGCAVAAFGWVPRG